MAGLGVRYGIATALFFVVSSYTVSDFDRKVLLPSVVGGTVLAFALEYLFTHVFVVDIPI